MRRLSFLPSSLLIGLVTFTFVFKAAASARSRFQSTSIPQGQVVDQNVEVVPRARISAQNTSTGVGRFGESDREGNYQIAALPVGIYRLEIKAPGFRPNVVERLSFEVARIVVQNFRLEVGDLTRTITVTSDAPLVESATVSVGQVIDQRTVEELPLNGRHFIDLGLLVPGSVTPPQNGNLSPPPLSSIQEFKVDNSTFSAGYGRNSGPIVNIATRRGTNEIHGELLEYFRNDAADPANRTASIFGCNPN